MYIPQNFLPKSRQKLLRSSPGQSFPAVAVMPLAAKVLKKVMVNNWTMNGEYGSEFGGFFPVQVRFTPAHERFHLALCSPGDVSQVWVLVLVNAGGEPFAVIQVQRRFAPEAVSHSLALAASLDTQGYSVNDIIHILMAEGGQA